MSGIKDLLMAQQGRIHAPANEIRDMLAVLADALMAGSWYGGPVGSVFWVDGVNGNNSWNGRSIEKPKLTIKAALALCVADDNDVILVIDYWQPTGEDWPIVVDKNLVHIIGMGQANFPYPAIHPPDDTAAFQLTSSGQYGSIENLTIGGGDAHGGIEWGNSGQVDGFLIKNCTFGHQWFGTPLNAIRQPGDSTRGGFKNRIEKCTFLSDLISHSGALTGNAIAQLSTTMFFYDLEIVDNVFKGCQRAINLLGSKDAVIEKNRFTNPDVASDGESIYLGAATLGCMMDDNSSFKGTSVMTRNPYYDAGTNHWGRNYAGGLSVMPDIV